MAVLPEYVLTSYPGRISIPDFADMAALEVGGPEYEVMGAMAQRLVAAGAYDLRALQVAGEGAEGALAADQRRQGFAAREKSL